MPLNLIGVKSTWKHAEDQTLIKFEVVALIMHKLLWVQAAGGEEAEG